MNNNALFPSLLALLREKGLTLAAAESCTGGWFSKSMVDLAGASEVFLGGVVSYASSVKADLLGVSHEDLASYTAVSAPVARQMAEGVARATGADIGVSVTGLAGPGGGTDAIPAGRVYIGVFYTGRASVKECLFPGTRTEVREAAVYAMADVLCKILSAEENKI